MSVCSASTIIVRINSFIVYVNVILSSAWCLIDHTSACWGVYEWVSTCVYVGNCSERLTLVLGEHKNMVYYMSTNLIIVMQSFAKKYRSRCKARKLLSSDKIRAVDKK